MGLFLNDGRFVEVEGPKPRLRLLGRSGQTEKMIELPDDGRVFHLVEVRPGLVAVAFNHQDDRAGLVTHLVDLSTSEVATLAPGLHVPYQPLSIGDGGIVVTDGYSIFLLNPDGMALDPITGPATTRPGRDEGN